MRVRQFLKGRVHVSWLITFVCLGFLGGVGLALAPSVGIFASPIWPILAAILIFFTFISRWRIMVIFTMIAGLLLGLWRGTLARVDLDAYNDFIGQNVILKGFVKDDPDFGAAHDLRLKLIDAEVILDSDYEKLSGEVENLDEYFSPLPGQIWVSVMAHGAEVKRSDSVEISGKLKSGFGTFPAAMSFVALNNVTRSPDADPMRDIRDALATRCAP